MANNRLEAMVLRPSLYPLSLEEQLAAVLKSQGWNCTISDKGIYARESMQLFGGFDALCQALRDPSTKKVIDAYRASNGPGARLSLDKRRYLKLDQLCGLLKVDIEDSEAMKPLRRLIDSEVLSPGVVLRCRRCRQRAWHRRSLVTDRFTCERCSLEQPVDREASSGYDEPPISYRLAEVVFQLLENHGQLPLLAINDQFSGSRVRPRGHTFELDIETAEGERKEVDMFYSDGSDLWIGEASINGRFDEGKLEFLARLATVLNAHGILLATSKKVWPESTVTAADQVFSGSSPLLQLRDHVSVTVP
jgi:hypothetical protein